MHLKKLPTPFRLGSTSFLLPADILPNVEHVAGLVDDVEILIFESDAISPLPSPEVINELEHIRAAHNMSYSVHLPLDVYLADRDTGIRQIGVEKCLRILSRFQPIRSTRYILHIEPQHTCADETGATQALKALIEGGFDPASVHIEYTSPFFHRIAPKARELGFAFCMDVGHLLLHQENPIDFMREYGRTIKTIHLHGVANGRDHHDLSCLDPQLLKAVLDFAAGSGDDLVLTIEVFKLDRFQKSLTTLEAFL